MRPTATTRPDSIRRHNLAVMLSQLHRDGALTRAELTQRLQVSRSTVGALVADLTQLGLVAEVVPNGGDRVGRPSHVVAPHPGGPYAVAVDIDVDHLTVATVRLGGAIATRRFVSAPATGFGPEIAARMITDAVRRCTEDMPAGALMAGIGISVPGTVDRHTGRVGVAPNLGWSDAPLGALLAGQIPTGVSVAIANDADLAVLAEHQRGSARDCSDVIYLMGRIGVGAGIIADGAPMLGHDGHAGEIGHDVLDASGPPCHCGKHGCIETYLGDGALLRLAGREGPATDAAVADVFAAAEAGEPAALGAVRAVADVLGRALASLVNTLNPQRVLLGGSLAAVLDLARPEVERSLEFYALETPMRSVQLAVPDLGADSALLGAAEIAFADLLADPLGASAALATG